MAFGAMMIGFCLIAIILSAVAVSRAGKGKNYKSALTAGIVIYALAIFGNMVGDKDAGTAVGAVVSIIILGVMFPICAKKAVSNNENNE